MHFLSIHHVLHCYNGLHIALQISVPVIVSGWWACYIWDIDRKELHVIDLVLSGCSYAEQNKHHEDTINLLHQGLFTCMRAFFINGKLISLDGMLDFTVDCISPSPGFLESYMVNMHVPHNCCLCHLLFSHHCTGLNQGTTQYTMP